MNAVNVFQLAHLAQRHGQSSAKKVCAETDHGRRAQCSAKMFCTKQSLICGPTDQVPHTAFAENTLVRSVLLRSGRAMIHAKQYDACILECTKRLRDNSGARVGQESMDSVIRAHSDTEFRSRCRFLPSPTTYRLVQLKEAFKDGLTL